MSDPDQDPTSASENRPPQSPSSRAGVSIPGYQPTEILGRTPSFGSWVRALQTRMDRTVLLKVLKSENPTLDRAFRSEISNFVRLEGRGVLPVIEEGSAGGFRYLVLDEARSKPLGESFGDRLEDWSAIVRVLEGIYRHVEAQQAVLAPVSASAWRQLPSGDPSLTDLGWIVPYESPILEEWDPQGSAEGGAKAGHNLRFLARSLRLLEAALDKKMPAALSRDVDRWQSHPLSEALPASLEPKPSRVGRGILVGSVVILVGLVALVYHSAVGDSAESPTDPNASSSSARLDVTESPETPPKDPSPDDSNGLSKDFEARSDIAYDLLTDIVGPLNQFPWERKMTPEESQSLLRVITAFPKTQEGRAASLIDSFSQTDQALKWAKSWVPFVEKARQQFAAGEYMEAEKALLEFRNAPEPPKILRQAADHWGGWTCAATLGYEPGSDLEKLAERLNAQIEANLIELASVPGVELSTDPDRVEALSQDMKAKSSEVVMQVKPAVETLRANRQYQPAIEKLRSILNRVVAEESQALLQLEETLVAEAKEYQQSRRQLELALDAAIDKGREGDWTGAKGVLRAALPESFSEVKQRADRWIARFDRAEQAAVRFRRALDKRRESEKSDSYRLVGREERVRGKVESVEQCQFEVKISGRRRQKQLEFSDLSLEEYGRILAEEGVERVPQEDWLLLCFLLGEPGRAIRELPLLGSEPEWQADAREVHDQLQRERLERMVRESKQLFRDKKFDRCRDLLIRIADQFAQRVDPKLWQQRRPELEERLSEVLDRLGPSSAFPGAAEVRWSEKRRLVELYYDFEGDDALKDWNQYRGSAGNIQSRQRLDRNRLVVQGLALLAPGGVTDIFLETVEIEILVDSRNSREPNLNVLIWASNSGDSTGLRGILGGHGFKKPGIGRLVGSNKSLALPGNVFGRLEDCENPRGLDYLKFGENPKAKGARCLRLSDDGNTVIFQIKRRRQFQRQARGQLEWSMAAQTDLVTGTVGLVPYAAEVEVDEVFVKGQLNPTWWQRWKKIQISLDLEGRQ